ncbi:ADP-ribosylglycohydrolase family protein [Fluviicola sp.]|uniref:ADP-ribosylglycohydrolase family protein n=1 Tax=Fluviicola sp. TaxID=1917219 RepID=UPI0031DF467E
MNLEKKIQSVFFGLAIGDALGVPVEFKDRSYLERHPVSDMIGYGTHNQAPGTFSDDGSLTFCLAEALTHDFSLELTARNFVDWYDYSYWTARGFVFDIGNATLDAIERLRDGERPDLAGGMSPSSNGNGSLMRIAPLLFYLLDKPIEERYRITKEVSSMTHAHIRSVIACFYYLEFARELLFTNDKFKAYTHIQHLIPSYLETLSINPEETTLFDRLLKADIFVLPSEEIKSSGYVLHTLEASIWCLLTTETYEDAVLKAVNLGDDTDTTGAVCGALAGLIYGWENIPEHWMNQLTRANDIKELAEKLSAKIQADNPGLGIE